MLRALLLVVFCALISTAHAAKAPATGDLGSRLLRHAREQIAGRHYREAVQDLRDFVNRFPDHPYADYAHYWLALAHFRQKEYALAEVTSDYLLYRHPASFKLGDAQLLNALCRWYRGDKPKAAEEIKKLLELHPRSELAAVAEEALFGKRR